VQIANQDNQIKFDKISHAYIADESLAKVLSLAVVCEVRDRGRPCLRCNHCDKALRGIHPDITNISKPDDKRDILVEQVRELRRDVYILPNEASQKAYVIHDAETMNHSAQNALLQVLEEPPQHVVFILCTNNPSALLETVRSRSIMLGRNMEESIADFPDSDDGKESGPAFDFLQALNRNDDVALMRCMFQIEKFDRPALTAFLTEVREQIVLTFKENLTSSNKYGSSSERNSFNFLVRVEDLLSKAEKMLRLNVNAGHIAGMICAGVLKKRGLDIGTDS